MTEVQEVARDVVVLVVLELVEQEPKDGGHAAQAEYHLLLARQL
jgi:hypothetical protein